MISASGCCSKRLDDGLGELVGGGAGGVELAQQGEGLAADGVLDQRRLVQLRRRAGRLRSGRPRRRCRGCGRRVAAAPAAGCGSAWPPRPGWGRRPARRGPRGGMRPSRLLGEGGEERRGSTRAAASAACCARWCGPRRRPAGRGRARRSPAPSSESAGSGRCAAQVGAQDVGQHQGVAGVGLLARRPSAGPGSGPPPAG